MRHNITLVHYVHNNHKTEPTTVNLRRRPHERKTAQYDTYETVFKREESSHKFKAIGGPFPSEGHFHRLPVWRDNSLSTRQPTTHS